VVFRNKLATSTGFVRFSLPEEAVNAVETLNRCEFEVTVPSHEMKSVLEVHLSGDRKTTNK